MKTALRQISLILLLINSVSFAQANATNQISAAVEENQPSVLLKINPAYLLLQELAVAVEFRAGKFTFGPIGSYSPEHNYYYSNDEDTFSTYNNERYSRYSYGAQGKYYFRGLNRHSAYVGAMAQYSDMTVKLDLADTTYSGRQDFMEVGAMGGFQWNWTGFILNVGGGFKHLSANDDFQVRSTDGDSIDYDAFGGGLTALILDVGVG